MTTLSDVINFNDAHEAHTKYLALSRGVYYQRKRRGRKLQFMIAGPSILEASAMVRWNVIKETGMVIEAQTDDGWCSLVPQPEIK